MINLNGLLVRAAVNNIFNVRINRTIVNVLTVTVCQLSSGGRIVQGASYDVTLFSPKQYYLQSCKEL